MTEHNIFCYSEDYGDEKSFQQKRYSAFNQEVGKERYDEILSQVKDILKNDNTKTFSEFWRVVTKKQWKQLLAIPEARDFKTGFEYISDKKIDLDDDLSGKIVEVKIDGKEYKAKIL